MHMRKSFKRNGFTFSKSAHKPETNDILYRACMAYTYHSLPSEYVGIEANPIL